MPVIMRIMRRSGPGLIWTPCILLMTPIEYHLHSFNTFQYVLFKCIGVPGMCPEPRWIDYPAPRSPADSFVMAGPIRHCLLRACITITSFTHYWDGWKGGRQKNNLIVVHPNIDYIHCQCKIKQKMKETRCKLF